MDEIWFWQRIVSPHMAGLASALAQRGYEVTYVAEQKLSADRVKLGWQIPNMQGVKLRFAENRAAVNSLVHEASARSVHFCQGIRGNGKISRVQRELSRCGLRQWVLMETIDDAGAVGIIKRCEYGRQFRSKGNSLEGVLAIGHTTVDWITARGMSAERVYPFAYFLPDVVLPEPTSQSRLGPFRFLFVGQFIKRKRLELLIHSLREMMDREFELLVVGSGPMEHSLHRLAESALPGRVRWLGRRAQTEVPLIMRQTDCLVLPSRHDGWGAVISEALMVGTPVICSDACGAAIAVETSRVGGVFQKRNVTALTELLEKAIIHGPVTQENRESVSEWARCLSAKAGADYLIKILDHVCRSGNRPLPPWDEQSPCT